MSTNSSSPIEVCFLLLAHKNKAQVLRLISALKHEHASVLVHFDAKMDDVPTLQEILAANPRCEVAPFRQSCLLDDWSLVDTTLKMCDYVISSGLISEGYLALVSGQDYPIKPIEELLQFLNRQYPKPFIDCCRITKGNWIDIKYSRTAKYNRFFKRMMKMRFRLLRRIVLRVARELDAIIMPTKASVKERMRQANIAIYGGSAWWILPVGVGKSILEEMRVNNDIIDIFKDSMTPEEVFFQTMIMRSKYAPLVDVDIEMDGDQNCLTFASFKLPGRSFNYHPHVIRLKDFDLIKKKKQFFARKFDMDIDSAILNRIDRELLQKRGE